MTVVYTQKISFFGRWYNQIAEQLEFEKNMEIIDVNVHSLLTVPPR